MIIPNPCVGICRIHQETPLCIGCYRTRREKIMWNNYTDDEKLEVLDLMELRKETYGEFENG